MGHISITVEGPSKLLDLDTSTPTTQPKPQTDMETDLVDDLGDLDVDDFNVDDVSLDPVRVPNGIYRAYLTSIYTNKGEKDGSPWKNSSIGILPIERVDSTDEIPSNPDPVYDLLWHPVRHREMGLGDKRKWKRLFDALRFKKNGYLKFKELGEDFRYEPENPIVVTVEIGLRNSENFIKRWGEPMG